jgi:hypothetical protein
MPSFHSHGKQARVSTAALVNLGLWLPIVLKELSRSKTFLSVWHYLALAGHHPSPPPASGLHVLVTCHSPISSHR